MRADDGQGADEAHGNEPSRFLMTGHDPKAAALARYLRQQAAFVSWSADVTDMDSTADAGLALFDAAAIADAMTTGDPRLRALSAAGLFESVPGGHAQFRDNPQIRAAIRRPLVSHSQAGVEIVAGLVATASAHAESPGEREGPTSPGQHRHPSLDVLSQRVREARAAVNSLRQQQVRPETMVSARHCLLAALDEYVGALETRRLPVPLPLKRELDMHHLLYD